MATVKEVGVQDEVVVKTPVTEKSDEVREKGQVFIENYKNFLKERTDAYKLRMADRLARPEIGTRILPGGYQYWNCLTVGPIQFYDAPPYRPSKIIAAGEETLILGVIWINPADTQDGGDPGTHSLAERDYRVRFETIDLTDVVSGPGKKFEDTFDSPAKEYYFFEWWHTWDLPGSDPNPKLYEVNFTADILTPGLEKAAFSTWHYDIDREPWFMVDLSSLDPNLNLPSSLTVGTQLPHIQFERPARFMVYPK